MKKNIIERLTFCSILDLLMERDPSFNDIKRFALILFLNQNVKQFRFTFLTFIIYVILCDGLDILIK